ncbi:hypothetical protein [Streptomyces sp. NPDC002172]
MPRLQWPRIVDRAAGIVTSYDEVGGCTLRQAYYRLVSEGLIPHTAPTYRRLSARLAQARREERFPDLFDRLREVHVPPAWQDVGDVPPARARLVRPGPDRRPVVSPVRGLREGHATGLS